MRKIYLSEYKSRGPEEVVAELKPFYEEQLERALRESNMQDYFEAEMCLAAINYAALSIENPGQFDAKPYVLKAQPNDSSEKMRAKTAELRNKSGLLTSLLFSVT